MRLKLFLSLLISAMLPAMAQTAVVVGSVIDADTGSPISGAVITIPDQGITVTTGPAGDFRISNALPGEAVINIAAPGYDSNATQARLYNGQIIDAGALRLFNDAPLNAIVEDTQMDLLYDETMISDEENNSQNVGALTGASDDIFYRFSHFGLSPIYSNYRGYGSNWQETYINGLPMNDLMRGGFSFSQLGGMTSRAFRNSTATVGLGAAAYGFGNIGGSQNFNTITDSYAPGFHGALSYTNSNYMFRAMVTYSTGVNAQGWGVTVSAIGRYANEGVVPGTFYNAGGLFISAEKRINKQNTLYLTAYGAPQQYANGRTVVQEAYDLVGDNLYNPTWGWQDGKKRSNNIREKFDPTVMLNWLWKTDNTTVNTGVAVRHTSYCSTGLSYFNGNDPSPVYYKNLPSYWRDVQESPETAEYYADLWRNDKNFRQINWEAMYAANYRNNLFNAESGNDDLGSNYMQYKNHSTQLNLIAASNVNHRFNDIWTLQGGANLNYTSTSDFQTVKDLLGGQFWYNWNTFGDRDMYAPNMSTDILQNDLQNPNRKVRQGERFGYDYNIYAVKAQLWAQAQVTLPHWDINFGANASYEQFYRNGNYQSGIAPNNSLGKSATHRFTDGAGKIGATYKLDGRNFFTLQAQYGTAAPVITDVYISPRYMDNVVDKLESATVLSATATYRWNYRRFRGAVSAYYTEMTNAIERYGFYDESLNTYCNYALSGVNRRYMGVELGMAYQILSSLRATVAGTFSRYQYQNNPMGTRIAENGSAPAETRQVFLKNYFCSSTPQTAINIGLSWQAPKNWYLNADAAWMADYYERLAYPYHETITGLDGYANSAAQLQELIDAFATQHKLPNQWVVNASVGKNIYIARKYSLNINVSVSNLLNNRNLVTQATQQFRVDTKNYNPQAYPTRYQYAQGVKVFVNAGIRF